MFTMCLNVNRKIKGKFEREIRIITIVFYSAIAMEIQKIFNKVG